MKRFRKAAAEKGVTELEAETYEIPQDEAVADELKHGHKGKRKKRRKPTLKTYVWLCFMAFAFCILVLLWVFQYFFLPKYYRSAKIRDIMQQADEFVEDFNADDAGGYARHMAFDNNMFILVVDENGEDVVKENNMGNYSFFSNDKDNNFGKTLYQFRQQLDEGDSDYVTKIIESEEFDRDEIFYCTKFNDGERDLYLFIEAPVEPIDSTISIIREQLIYISVIIFELAFIITILISSRLSRPIEKLTSTAKTFGEGDYDVEFKAEGYREIEELSVVLDDARNEVRKVTDLRKDLIANISHDLRTPLAMVKAYAEMIRDLSGDNREKREKHCQIIIDEADRLSNLVGSILELSKLESSNEEFNRTDYSVQSLIKDVLLRYTLLIEEQGYDIRFIPDDDRMITADYDKMAQVLYNFINNAINYSGEDKHIWVKQINRPGVVRIEVIDNGQGIPKDKLSEVFDRYYRGGKVKRETVGTGLGLSICQEILKKHGYAYGVMSEEGKGSTFWFEARETVLPKKQNPPEGKDEVISADFIDDKPDNDTDK
ncbi:MAG: HAMP domain-containing histidine kinase [Ruminococcus sp.]|nr:HAMP domain-containing histidine kinase [Ruminococcus sp.]